MTTPSFYLKIDDEFNSFITKADSLLREYEIRKQFFSLKFLKNWTNFLNAEVGTEEAGVGTEERARKRMRYDSNTVTQFSTYWEELHEYQKEKLSKIPISSLQEHFKNNALVQEVLNDLSEEGNIISFGCFFCSDRFDKDETRLAHINDLDDAKDLGFLLKMRTYVYSADSVQFPTNSNSSKIKIEDSTIILDERYLLELLSDSPTMQKQLSAWKVHKMFREVQKQELAQIFTKECSELKERCYKKKEYCNRMKAWIDIRNICHEENLRREQNIGYNAKTYKSILFKMEGRDERVLMLEIMKAQLMDAKTDNDFTEIVTEHINDLRLKVCKIDAILLSTVHGIKNTIEKLRIRSTYDHGLIIAPILSIFIRAQLQVFAQRSLDRVSVILATLNSRRDAAGPSAIALLDE